MTVGRVNMNVNVILPITCNCHKMAQTKYVKLRPNIGIMQVIIYAYDVANVSHNSFLRMLFISNMSTYLYSP